MEWEKHVILTFNIAMVESIISDHARSRLSWCYMKTKISYYLMTKINASICKHLLRTTSFSMRWTLSRSTRNTSTMTLSSLAREGTRSTIGGWSSSLLEVPLAIVDTWKSSRQLLYLIPHSVSKWCHYVWATCKFTIQEIKSGLTSRTQGVPLIKPQRYMIVIT